jgi:hypothetical protein
MGKAVLVLLVLVALAVEALFVLTGAGVPRTSGPLATPLGAHAGSIWIGVAGAALFLVAVLLLGRGGAERPYATRETLLVVVVASSAAFTLAAMIGVGRGWSPETLAALALGGVTETLVAVGLCLRIATHAEKRKLLFVPGVIGAVLVGAVQLFVVTLGGA